MEKSLDYSTVFRQIDKQRLMSKSDVLEFLKANGEHEPSIAMISDRYVDQYGIDPVWRYPLSDGWHTGAFIIPVQEGYLWLPYDEVDPDYFELVLPEAATMLDTECCERFKNELHTYADELCKVLTLIGQIIGDERGE